MFKNSHRESRHWKIQTEGRELIVLIKRKDGGQREGARCFLPGWAPFQSGIPLLVWISVFGELLITLLVLSSREKKAGLQHLITQSNSKFSSGYILEISRGSGMGSNYILSYEKNQILETK